MLRDGHGAAKNDQQNLRHRVDHSPRLPGVAQRRER
jgi:hypothetical protein